MEVAKTHLSQIRSYTLGLAIGWTVAVVLMFAVDLNQEHHQVIEIARAEALTNINKDLAYRRWASALGGVYAPITNIAPNPFLQVPNRDVTTTTGLTLTLVNPAYMTRQVIEMSQDQYGFRAHLTSLKPLRPQNAADAWESTALIAFEQGQKEASELVQQDGQEYLRIMVPFVVEASCLKCHGAQNYQVGDVRGGLSASIPLAKYASMQNEFMLSTVATDGLLWVMGIIGLYIAMRSLQRWGLERERAFNLARESEERFRTLVTSLDDIVYTLDTEQRHVGVYGSWVEKSGLTPQYFLGQTATTLMGAEAARVHIASNNRALTGEVVRYEWTGLVADTTHYYQTVISPLRDAAGVVTGLVGIGRDITEQKQIEAEIKNAKDELERFFAVVPDLVCVATVTGYFKKINPAWETILGYSTADILRTPLEQFLHPDDVERTRQELRNLGDGQNTNRFINRYRTRGGDYRWLEWDASPAIDGAHVYAVARDITQRRETEEALRYERDRAQSYFDTVEALIVAIDANGNITAINRKGCQLLGYTEQELLGRNWFTTCLRQPEGRDVIYPYFRQLIEGESPGLDYYENPVLTRTGELRHIAWHNSLLRNKQGDIIGSLSAGEDITERQQAVEALRVSEEKFAKAFQHAPALMTISTLTDGQYIDVNDEFLRVSGFSREEVIGKTSIELGWVTPLEREPLVNALQTHGHIAGLEMTFHTKAKRDVQCLVNGELLMLNGKTCLLSLAQDVTERKKTEAALHETEAQTRVLLEIDRIRTELIANVSHELRTPLGLILAMSTTLLRRDATLDAATQTELLTAITEEAERLANIVDNLLDAARLQNGRLRLDLQPTELGVLVEHTLTVLQPQLAHHHVIFQPPPSPLNLVVDAKRIEQVIRNLINNAIKYSQPETTITVRVARSGQEVIMSVCDEGLGISPEDQSRLFTRFYRSASAAVQRVSGAGLGLSISRGIVEMHGGRIWVESELHHGSTFWVALPLATPTTLMETPPLGDVQH